QTNALSCTFLFSITQRPPSSTLFPYTTLFRSVIAAGRAADLVICDAPIGSIAADTLGALAAGDLPGISMILIDGRITIGRSISSDRKSTRLNSSHVAISYAVFRLKKKTANKHP